MPMMVAIDVKPHDELLKRIEQLLHAQKGGKIGKIGVIFIDSQLKSSYASKMLADLVKLHDEDKISWVLVWKVGDYDVPRKHPTLTGGIIAYAKNVLSLLENGREPSETDVARFVQLFDRAVASWTATGNKDSSVDVILVSCRHGLSRSPAVAIWAADRLGLHKQAELLKQRYRRTYNRLLYELLHMYGPPAAPASATRVGNTVKYELEEESYCHEDALPSY